MSSAEVHLFVERFLQLKRSLEKCIAEDSSDDKSRQRINEATAKLESLFREYWTVLHRDPRQVIPKPKDDEAFRFFSDTYHDNR